MIVGIVGLGLIGGSLGLELRSQSITVLGVSRREETCEIALERGIVDQASTSLSLLAAVDVIFICTPLDKIRETVEQLIPYLQTSAIITDVGSAKGIIVEECAPLWQNFVGGHPMAGTERSGIEAAERGLFKDAAYVLTPTERTPTEAVQAIEAILRSLGANIHHCTPAIHDRAVAWISHLPVIISAGLIESCLGETDPNILELAQELASSGFRDTSRVGGGDPHLGAMMAQYNHQALLRSLFQYRQHLDHLIKQIEQENWDSLEKCLEKTQKRRSHFGNFSR